MLSAVFHIKCYNGRQCLSISVVFINCSEMLWGIYLSCLLVADNVFPVHRFLENACWQSSFLCFLSSTLSLSATFLHPVFLSLLSTCRMFVTLHPFNSHFKDKTFVFHFSQCVSVTCVLLSVSIVVLFEQVNGHLPDVVCLLFVDPNKHMQITKILTLSTLSLNLSASVWICYANYKTWVTVSASAREVRKSSSSKNHIHS